MISILEFIFLNLAFALIVIGFLVNTMESYLPSFISKNFRYGKFSYTGSERPSVSLMEFPKSYFNHFYISGTVVVFSSFWYACNIYYYGSQVPEWFMKFLDFWCGSDRTEKSNAVATMIALLLLSAQCARRFYETFFIQVFSKNAKINLSHYLIGHFHYFGCAMAILGNAAGFTRPRDDPVKENPFSNMIFIIAIPAIALFTLAWINQFRSNLILAKLRKNSSNKVISEKYYLPINGGFRYVSSPHLLCEILIYVSLQLILIQNFTWLCILAWVVCNQVETAILSHEWYKKTFPKFPKDRKVLVPFIF